MWSPLYRRGTWITILLIVFHELTGINAIMLYSNEIFKQMSSAGTSSISPRTGTYLVGLCNFLGQLFAVFIIRRFPRRTLLIPGHLLIALCHLLVGVCAIQGLDTGVLAMILLFLVVYEITNGPIIWLYVSEVVVDSALGVCIFSLWGVALLLTLTTNFMMKSAL